MSYKRTIVNINCVSLTNLNWFLPTFVSLLWIRSIRQTVTFVGYSSVMAFQNYMNGTSMPEVSGGGHQQQQIQQQQNPGQQAAPSIVPLSLELVPPVLCQSFGVPMHDQFVQRIGYGVPGAMRPRNDMFRFGHAENYQAQHFLTDQTQMPYQPSLASIGQMGPLVYGLGNGAVGFAQQANANRVMQYNTALAQQQSQNQQSSAQQGHPQHGQQQADAPAAQAMQHAHMPACQPFYRSPGIAVAGHGYIDANMLRHPMMQGADGRSGKKSIKLHIL